MSHAGKLNQFGTQHSRYKTSVMTHRDAFTSCMDSHYRVMNFLQETGVSTYEPPDGGASPAEDTDWNANPIAKAHGTASVGSNECGNISMNANPMMFKGKGKSGSVAGAKPKRDVQPVMILQRDRLDALLFTPWIFIPAYCFAIP